MIEVQQFINQKLAEVAERLPSLVHTEPASFSCGFNTGYKQALLDLDKRLEEWGDNISFYYCAHCKEEYCSLDMACGICGLKGDRDE